MTHDELVRENERLNLELKVATKQLEKMHAFFDAVNEINPDLTHKVMEGLASVDRVSS